MASLNTTFFFLTTFTWCLVSLLNMLGYLLRTLKRNRGLWWLFKAFDVCLFYTLKCQDGSNKIQPVPGILVEFVFSYEYS